MAGGVRYEVKGGRELRRSLNEAAGSLDDLKATHMKAAMHVVPRAVTLVPKRSGALSRTIRPGATARAAIIRAGSARVPYAGVIEWGWGRRNIAAEPYLTRAARETEGVWVNDYTTDVQAILDKVKGARGYG